MDLFREFKWTPEQLQNMCASDVEMYHEEVARQKRDEDYIQRYWQTVQTCILLQPNLKEGTKIEPEDFIGQPPWVKVAVAATPKETDMELKAIAESKGLRGPRDGT